MSIDQFEMGVEGRVKITIFEVKFFLNLTVFCVTFNAVKHVLIPEISLRQQYYF